MYWSDGNREMRDYLNDKEEGVHVILHQNGKTTLKKY